MKLGRVGLGPKTTPKKASPATGQHDICAKVSSDQACLQNLLREAYWPLLVKRMVKVAMATWQVAAIVGALPPQSIDLAGARVEIFVENPEDTSTDPPHVPNNIQWASHDHMIVDSVWVSNTTV